MGFRGTVRLHALMLSFAQAWRRIIAMKDLSSEVPRDQEWITVEGFERQVRRSETRMLPCRGITCGPQYHWFGYYDKFQTDPTDRFVLSMRADFEGRTPQPEDYIEVGMIDTHQKNAWIPLGRSKAWNWQQGCMLQWLPQSPSKVLWNDRVSNRFVCRIRDVFTGDESVIDCPIYHVHPDGKAAVCLDYSRIQSVRLGYGYAGLPDPQQEILRPDKSCMEILDLTTGRRQGLFSVADIANGYPYQDAVEDDDKHYFIHAQWSPDGSRFLFLRRWSSISGRFPDFNTRMFTASADGGDIRLVTDKPLISHFVWHSPRTICIWREDGFKMFADDGSGVETTVYHAPNGHQSFLPGGEWMIADSYADPTGFQNLYLYNLRTAQVMPIGRYFLPADCRGEFRCDLHPRLTRSGRTLLLDTVHGGLGRQMVMVDLPV
jgi:hypothetical protein